METITNRLSFNGIDLRNYGLYVSGDKVFDSPKRSFKRVSIPGRSGDLFDFEDKYENVSVTYTSILIEDFANNAASLRSILLSPKNYCRIEDDYNPDEYRMGVFLGPVNFQTVYLEAASTDLTFDCMPQRWLKSGETPIDINVTSKVLNNATQFSAKPLIKIVGYGKIKFAFSYADSTTSEITIQIPQANSGTYYIDCNTMECYKEPSTSGIYPNSFITVDEFPVLKPGNTTITITKTNASVSEMKITPRWYIL